MDTFLPPTPGSLSLKPVTTVQPALQLPPKDWPHAPVHRMSEHGIYFVTAGTLRKEHLFDAPARRDLLEGMLLSLAKGRGWQLEAWAVFANHYHFVARGCPDSRPIGDFVGELHSRSAIALNKLDGVEGRPVWFNFRETRLTFQRSYLARLNYVHQNAVRHGMAQAASQYPWCSAAWFERTASPAVVKTIYRFKTGAMTVPDDY